MSAHQKDVDGLTRQAEELRQLGAEGAVEPVLSQLTTRWHQLHTHVHQHNKPDADESLLATSTATVTMAAQPVTSSTAVTRCGVPSSVLFPMSLLCLVADRLETIPDSFVLFERPEVTMSCLQEDGDTRSVFVSSESVHRGAGEGDRADSGHSGRAAEPHPARAAI